MATTVPYRQIRAHLPSEDTVTLYAAFNTSIATAAVSNQKLTASPLFSTTRTTWLKPSWCWMMYRCGYAAKDKGQEKVLSLEVKRDWLFNTLSAAIVNEHSTPHAPQDNQTDAKDTRKTKVVVQWDPERDFKIQKLAYRSIQIGIPGAFLSDLAENGIVKIEDVTAKATALKAAIDQKRDASEDELRELRLLPEEVAVELPHELRAVLKMDMTG